MVSPFSIEECDYRDFDVRILGRIIFDDLPQKFFSCLRPLKGRVFYVSPQEVIKGRLEISQARPVNHYDQW
jgi:hypothetical protein